MAWDPFRKIIPALKRKTGDGGARASQPPPTEFQLDLSPDWQSARSDAPEMWRFDSELKRSNVLVSVMLVPVPKERLLHSQSACREAPER